MPRSFRLALLVLVGLWLPFLGKPVHIDDTNFLALARGARLDPWRPHAITINWQGRTEPAFEVLSNPPGIAWWLAPMDGQPVWALHLWMLPWLLLAAWGAWTLGARFAGRPAAALLLLLGAPAAVLAAQALTPDLPLFACALAGMAGLTSASGPPWRAWPWALLLGATAIFRYSGLVFIPVAGLWALCLRGRRGGRDALLLASAASLPILLLSLHDAQAYGRLHLLAMTGFQGVADSPREVFRKLAASLAMLGGGLLLPVLAASRPAPALLGLVGGLLVGAFAATLSDHSGPAALATLFFCGAGGASLGGLLPGGRLGRPEERLDREALFLLLWALLGGLFLLKLRFTATRYGLPFFIPLVLLALRMARPGAIRLAVPLTLGLSALLAVDDLGLARAQERLAIQVDRIARQEIESPGLFAGHWGWQHHLEARGWRALEEDEPLPRRQILAISRASWPQEPGEGCRVLLERLVAPGPRGWPRIHSWSGAANIHASAISAPRPVESYAPWTLAADPYDEVELWQGCRVGGPGPAE